MISAFEYPDPSIPSEFVAKSDAFVSNFVTFSNNWTDFSTRSPTGGLLSTTSATSVAIGEGSKSFVLAVNKAFLPGMFVMIANTAAPTNYMYGTVTSYTSGTLTLIVNVLVVGGSGTLAAWTISASCEEAVTGGSNHSVRVAGFFDAGSTGNTHIPNYMTLLENIGSAITPASNAVDGASFTINIAGYYIVTVGYVDAAETTIGVSRNSTQLSTSIDSITITNVVLMLRPNQTFVDATNWGSSCVFLNAGDVLRPHSSAPTGGIGSLASQQMIIESFMF